MDKRIFIVIGGVVLLVGIIVLFKIMTSKSDVCPKLSMDATPRMLVIGTGEKIQFSDNTPEATEWLWNFGDGTGTSDEQNPSYEYDKSGRFIVKLTVNGKCSDTLSILVKSFIPDTDKVVVQITAPAEADAGTPVHFAGVADGATKWYWKFGETTHYDDSTQTPTYTYKTPGKYNVFLKTDNANKPAEWSITVYPKQKPAPVNPTPVNPTPVKPKPNGGGTPPPPPPPPPSNSGPSAPDIQAHLQSMSKKDRMNTEDKKWINENFILGLSTPVKVPSNKDIKTLND